MSRVPGTDVWRVVVPGAHVGQRYKYRLQTVSGAWVDKADPFAISAEIAPCSASQVDRRAYRWRDSDWMGVRQQRNPWEQPMSVYEVHLGSWGRHATKGEPSTGRLRSHWHATFNSWGLRMSS